MTHPYRWSIPAKTFLLGEYAALAEQGAILLTTEPCFELSLVEEPGLHGIHPASPAGRFWAQSPVLSPWGIQWFDPYAGMGGFGASSAQFVGLYRAATTLMAQSVDPEQLLAIYNTHTHTSHGLSPSGYDVLAQLQWGCVYIHRQQGVYQSYSWPFTDIRPILVHTRHKITTHQHLSSLHTIPNLHELCIWVASAKTAMDQNDAQRFIESIRAYHHALQQQQWVALHTLRLIDTLYALPGVHAIKGCGAMGADVVLLIVETAQYAYCIEQLRAMDYYVIGDAPRYVD